MPTTIRLLRAPPLIFLLLAGSAILFMACRQPEHEPTPAPRDIGLPSDASGYDEDSYPRVGEPLFHERWIDSLDTEAFDFDDVDAVFWYIFSRLPDGVTVYPSENYYYFSVYSNGQQYWGNIRLPANSRDKGVLSFGYFEFADFADLEGSRDGRSKFYSDADGLVIEKVDDFTYVVRYKQKSVTFNLHQLRQEPPKLFPLGQDEVFVERTFDESGYQFFLLFNEVDNYFFWVLNEEEGSPDSFEAIAEDTVVGNRSGFAFWLDKAHDDRKVLVAIRHASVMRNDYYDGPFDQLADNYVDETNISTYMEQAFPNVQGRIDKYGYYTDTEASSRVAISAYGNYHTRDEILDLVEGVKTAADPYHFIAHGGTGFTD